ncbi:transcription factor bHLH110-like isoform X2 [Ipomoea triloba]|uniref:transcription factor bHLH110-like isoform X2 n=1 Tax=Ipomoea triloba TaxID=35885 RepID=UPI00125D74BC|nr:transcription factor bHLH110-like isoform X2 [Ipomoea triloba]
MESAHLHNHHHHHHQHHQQFQDPPPPPSSSSPSSSYGGVSTSSTAHSWTPNTTLLSGGGGGLSSLVAAGSVLSSRNHHQPMAQDLSFHHWANAAAAAGFAGGGGVSGQGIKQELSSATDCYPPRLAAADMQNTLDAKLLLGTLSGGGHQPAAAAAAGQQFYGSSAASSNASSNRGRFSQIYPTISVPSLNIEEASSLANSSSLGMNLQALDLFNSARINGAFVAHTSPDHQHLGFHNYAFDHHHHLQQSAQRTFPSNVSSPLFSHATVAISADPKRPCNLVEPNPPQAPPKKSRLDSRASCPPFKVRKEKLGDRIAALQQLVAPFGKTDTASVLMEAIGYIKFLQNQVETLSVPYMKLSRNKSSGRAMQGVIKHLQGQEENIGSEEARRDLRSRGLCLVPLSCLSYVTDSGGGVWPPPSLEHFSPIQ